MKQSSSAERGSGVNKEAVIAYAIKQFIISVVKDREVRSLLKEKRFRELDEVIEKMTSGGIAVDVAPLINQEGAAVNTPTQYQAIKKALYGDIDFLRSQEDREIANIVWKHVFKELFNVGIETLFEEEEKKGAEMTKSEKDDSYINMTAEEWARRIRDLYKRPETLNFGDLLTSMENRFGGTKPSLPGQLERGESSKNLLEALSKIKGRIIGELGKITNMEQLTAIRKGGALKKLEDRIEAYKILVKKGSITNR
jgi:hypothetical protein